MKITKALLSVGSVAAAVVLFTGSVHGQATNAAPVAASQPARTQVTEEQFKRYYELFNKGDTKYADFLAENLVYVHPSGKLISSREEYVEHYKKQPEKIHDDRVPTFIVIDNERRRAAVEMRNRFWADEGKTYTFENGTVVRGGELWESSVVIFYEFDKEGKITKIQGAKTGPGPLKRIK